MKFKYFQLAILGFSMLLTACYDDQGSYDYHEVNEVVIDTMGFKTQYTVEVAGQLVIDPKITFTQENVSESDLSYEWYFYRNMYHTAVWYPVSDKKKLELTIIYESGAYLATLYVKDKKSNLISSMNFDVNVISKISHGLVVLHTDGTSSDFDYIATPNTVEGLEENVRIANAFSTLNGRKFRGTPLTIAQVGVDDGSQRVKVNRIYVSTDEEFLQINARSFLFEHDASEIFIQQPAYLHFEAITGKGGGQQIFFINNGDFHRITAFQHMEDYNITSAVPPGSLLSGSVKLSPFIIRVLSATGSTSSYPAFYDMIGKRFVTVADMSLISATLRPYATQQSDALFDVNNIGKDILYAGRGFNRYGYAVFTGGPSDYWLYVINFPLVATTLTADNLAVEKFDLSALPEIQNAQFFDMGERGNALYYATDRNIYTYSSPSTVTKINDDFPAGEKITAMKLFKFEGGVYANGGFLPFYENLNGSILHVATWNGVQGKLYEFRVNVTNGIMNKTPLNVFENFGKIVDMDSKIQYRERL